MNRFVTACVVLLVVGGCRCGKDAPPPDDPGYPVIDIHAHAFNLRYLPLREIAASKSKLIPRLLTAWLVARTKAYDFGEGAESRRDAPYIDSPDKVLESLGATDAEIQELYDFLEIESSERARRDAKQLEEAILAHQPLRDEHESHGPAGERRGSAVLGVIELARHLMRDEVDQVEQFHDGFPYVRLMVHHMMDMGKAYGQSPKGNTFYSFKRQLVRMRALDNHFTERLKDDDKTGPVMFHFVAFDPFLGDSLARVKRGVEDYGALGVKFYPPSGYRPAQNKREPRPGSGAPRRHWVSRYADNSDAVIDARCRALLEYCADERVPIFAHCTPDGFQAAENYGLNSNPGYWRVAIEGLSKDRQKSLLLCLGHAGGEADWFRPEAWPALPKPREFDAEPTHYGRHVADLCVKYPGVYAGLGFHKSMLVEEARVHLKARLKRLFGNADTEALSKKLLYGSDWTMVSQERHWKRYRKRCQEVYADMTDDQTRDFFCRNALRFLRIDERLQCGDFDDTPHLKQALQALIDDAG